VKAGMTQDICERRAPNPILFYVIINSDTITLFSKTIKEITSMTAIVDPEKCIGCAACCDCCPVTAIEMNAENKAIVNADTCIDCEACVSECPVDAITMSEK